MTVGFQGYGRTRGFEFPDGRDAPVAPPGRGMLRYNGATQQFEASVESANYEAFGGLGGGGTTVDDLTALGELDDAAYDNGVSVAVASVRDFFELDTTSSETIDGITVLGTVSGMGRWVRRNLPSAVWAARDTWYLNALTGDDENDGATSGTALATHAELERRLGRLPIDIEVTVHVETDISGKWWVAFNTLRKAGFAEGTIVYMGAAPTVVRSGAFTAGTRPWVDAPAASREDGQIVDTSIGGDWEIDVGQRIVATSGAATGAYTWNARNVSANTARTSRWFDPATGVEVGGPSAGDDYDIEQLVVLTGSVDIQQNAHVRFVDMAIGNESLVSESMLLMWASSGAVVCVGCDLRGTQYTAGPAIVNFVMGSRIFCREVLVIEGGSIGIAASMIAGRLFTLVGATLSFDLGGGLVFQNPGVPGAGTWPGSAGANVTSPVLSLRQSTMLTLDPIAMYDYTAAGATAVDISSASSVRQFGELWARDCTPSTGVRVRSGCVYNYLGTADSLPDIDTPAAQDTLIGGAAVAFGSLPSTTPASLAAIIADT